MLRVKCVLTQVPHHQTRQLSTLTKLTKNVAVQVKEPQEYSTTSISIEDTASLSNTSMTSTTAKPIISSNRVATATVRPKMIAWEDAKPYNTMPGPKPLPIVGNSWRFVLGEFKGMDPVGIHKALYNKYGKICSLRNVIGRPDTIFMFDPEYIQEMYMNESIWPIRDILKVVTHYRKVMRKDTFKDVIGLPVSQGQEWLKIRSAVNPILMKPRINEEFIPKIEVAAREFLKRVSKLAAQNPEMPENFIDEVNKYTLESVSYVAINRRFGLMNDELTPETMQIITSTVRAFELIYELDMRPSIWKVVPTPMWRELVRHMDFLTDIYMKLIDEEIEKQMNKTNFVSDEDKSILQKFLAVDKQIAITVVFDTLAAGVDTTSKTLAAILYLMGKHKHVQNKLRKEIMEVIPDENTPMTPELLNKCKYLRAVIKESQRLHGVSLGNIRSAEKDIVIGGYQIPKGVELVGANFIMLNSDEWIPRAKEFLPERYLRDEENADISMKNVNKFLYLPFGYGPRSCVGKRIANLELEISLAMILRKFRLDWKQPDMRFRATIMYGLCDPLKLHIYPYEKGQESIEENEQEYKQDVAIQ